MDFSSAPFDAALALPTGEVFYGYGIGAKGSTFGEICFNTSITGYQEILTDPSYDGQIITFTFPHIGNVGTNSEDIESTNKPSAKGLIIRENITNPSSWRNTNHFNQWLKDRKITGICGIDTRAITKHIRLNGAQNVAIGYGKNLDIEKLKALAKNNPDLSGKELTENASCEKIADWQEGLWKKAAPAAQFRIAAIDYGIKSNILRNLVNSGFAVKLYPAKTTAQQILKDNPDGIFLSNGPGDPAATSQFAIPIIKELIASGKPVFGICMGHQLLATALGCTTEKMFQGHRGANHPVQDLQTKKVEITSQNHGFVVSENTPKNVDVTHRSLFDNSIAGIKSGHCFSVQYHPEASPGPHDSHYLFKRFFDMVKKSAAKKAA
ncbi:MAG: carbamoyl phosphate synthase small subunit [Alphaproteobacteria bacterium CG11_big_fil_rev_8_21_14_0_20_44_7]|nr:MAG: carbamoyl phosphate synthase small subunit [Alphaproteobacteria bacterium CG11_big_fil_rev_8_21_14_0_20_44_7]